MPKLHLMQMFIYNAATHMLGAWRDPHDQQVAGLTSFAPWKAMARKLEAGCFDGVFFADTASVHSVYKDSAATCIEHGASWPTHDPMPLVAVMADATTHLGFGVTQSTAATPPYLAVRRMSTLDNLTGGRIGWNIVTGVSPSEHKANGLEQMSHDERYDYADEYMDVCYALWDAVPRDAILIDKASGHFADASRVRPVTYHGKYVRCDAWPPTLPSPQGRPVLFQAGSSGRGTAFAVKHAEVVFAIQPHLSAMQSFMRQIRAAAADAGRPQPPVLFGIQPIIGSTEEEARRRLAEYDSRIPTEAILARLSGLFGQDLSRYDLDMPVDEIQGQASRGLLSATAASEDGHRVTLREAVRLWGISVGIPQVVGTPEQIVDRMEAIWRETGCFGFNISPTVAPDCVDSFVDEIVPRLQARGIFRREYPGKTFRDTLSEQ